MMTIQEYRKKGVKKKRTKDLYLWDQCHYYRPTSTCTMINLFNLPEACLCNQTKHLIYSCDYVYGDCSSFKFAMNAVNHKPDKLVWLPKKV